jgi:hypothetical protein
MPTAIEFGRFRIPPHRRELIAESRPLDLAGRAFARRVKPTMIGLILDDSLAP